MVRLSLLSLLLSPLPVARSLRTSLAADVRLTLLRLPSKHADRYPTLKKPSWTPPNVS